MKHGSAAWIGDLRAKRDQRDRRYCTRHTGTYVSLQWLGCKISNQELEARGRPSALYPFALHRISKTSRRGVQRGINGLV